MATKSIALAAALACLCSSAQAQVITSSQIVDIPSRVSVIRLDIKRAIRRAVMALLSFA